MFRTIIVLLAVASTSCTTGDKIKELELGMTRAEVIDSLGKPDGVRTSESCEALTYANRVMSWTSNYYDRTDYTVVLCDGLVSEYGPGEVRQRETGVLYLFNMN